MKHVQKSNKHIKKNFAPSWFYLQDHTRMHGQQNIILWEDLMGRDYCYLSVV